MKYRLSPRSYTRSKNFYKKWIRFNELGQRMMRAKKGHSASPFRILKGRPY